MIEAVHNATSKHRILVVDDQPIFRDGLRYWIDRQPDMECCGEADSIAAARRAMTTLKPDLLLTDLTVRGDDGLELIKELRAQYKDLRVIVLTHHEEMAFGDRALRAGAQGYIMKERPANDLLSGLRAVLGGEMYVSQRLAAVMLRKLCHGTPTADVTVLLSNRELQVFQMLGSGIGTREVSRKLRLSVKTVETYREHIKRKLALKDATSLMHAATTWVQGNVQPSGPRP